MKKERFDRSFFMAEFGFKQALLMAARSHPSSPNL